MVSNNSSNLLRGPLGFSPIQFLMDIQGIFQLCRKFQALSPSFPNVNSALSSCFQGLSPAKTSPPVAQSPWVGDLNDGMDTDGQIRVDK